MVPLKVKEKRTVTVQYGILRQWSITTATLYSWNRGVLEGAGAA